MFRQKWFWIVLLAAACAAIIPVLADDHEHEGRPHGRHRQGHHDHDIARGALERGEIAPLEEVLAEVRKTATGQIMGIKLEREHGKWVYEFRILGAEGSMLEVHADARTKEILEIKGK
jgi:uncharacterized membrane protein YkoI